jgi:hypothetical protein
VIPETNGFCVKNMNVWLWHKCHSHSTPFNFNNGNERSSKYWDQFMMNCFNVFWKIGINLEINVTVFCIVH